MKWLTNLGGDAVTVVVWVDMLIMALRAIGVKALPFGVKKWQEKESTKEANREKKQTAADDENGNAEPLNTEFGKVNAKIMRYWIRYLEQRGVRFELGTEEAIAKLNENNALGMFEVKLTNWETNEFSRKIYLFESPSTGTFLEECYHAVQSLEFVRMYADVIYKGKKYYRVDNWEFLAKKRILDNAGRNGLSYAEYIELEKQLELVLMNLY